MDKITLTLEQLIEFMPGHFYWLNRDNVYEGCNDQQARALGLKSRHEIVGKKNNELTAISSDIASIWDINNFNVLNSGQPLFFEEPTILEGGSHATVLSRKIPLLNANGSIIGLFGFSVDITPFKNKQDELSKELAQTNLSLKHILAHMPGHVYWKNKSGVYLGCNDRQAKTLGLSSGSEVIGKTDFELPWGPTLAETYRENDLRIMSSGISEEFEEIAYIHDQPIIYLSLKTRLNNEFGETVGILGISIDITKQKDFEKKLVEAKEIAEKANNAKSEFLYNMRHDLRTPFSGILGMAECLEIMEQDLHKKESLNCIMESGRVFLDHMDQIFDFINIEQGQVLILEKQFNLRKVIEDLFKMLLPAAKNKNLILTTHIAEDLPTHVIGDQIRLERILINLLSNSVKFTENGSITLSLKIIKKIERSIVIKFMIEDTGIGIPEDKINLLFQSFNRLTPAFSSVYPGQGLGLKVVKEFVDEMNGEIHVQSELGQGSIFKILIPFKTTFMDCSEEEL